MPRNQRTRERSRTTTARAIDTEKELSKETPRHSRDAARYGRSDRRDDQGAAIKRNSSEAGSEGQSDRRRIRQSQRGIPTRRDVHEVYRSALFDRSLNEEHNDELQQGQFGPGDDYQGGRGRRERQTVEQRLIDQQPYEDSEVQQSAQSQPDGERPAVEAILAEGCFERCHVAKIEPASTKVKAAVEACGRY